MYARSVFLAPLLYNNDYNLILVPKDGSNDALPHTVKIGLGVGIPLVIIVLLSALILLVILVFKLCKSKTDLKRKLTEKE